METIPGPRGLPIVGNLLDLQHEEGFLRAMENLADIYGPVYQIAIGGKRNIICSSADLLLQLTDETQWVKAPPPALAGNGGANGLFLAGNDDPDWGQAHRILVPKFGPLAIGDMFDGMRDIAYQMILKWARQDQEHQILLTNDFTRLTLDTIALCSMDYRFNSFYSEKMHPFVDSMLSFLALNQKLAVQPVLMRKFLGSADEARKKEDVNIMARISQEIISRRRGHPKEDANDMLNTLLYDKDPKTGDVMRDELIQAQMLTFLIAGHETTSGLLSFAFMNLLQTPRAYLKAQLEVDEVLGSGIIDLDKIKNLKYVNAVLRETLRLFPTAPILNKRIPAHRQHDLVTICDGKYRVENDVNVKVLLGKSMTDPYYFGEDAREFNPDRMSEDNPNYEEYMKAWKPFGNGARSCIGQAFAWQEAVMITALILQNFDITFVDPGYKVKIKQTLTIKPDQMYVKIKPRNGLDAFAIEKRLFSQSKQPLPRHTYDGGPAISDSSQKGPTILYGSNSGTCQSLAQKLAQAFAIKQGRTTTVQDLDSAVNNFSTEQPLIVITSSYEGKPPDNAARFLTWLEHTNPKRFVGAKYAVFGCGNIDWRDTFQRVPTTVDQLLEKRGATRIVPMGSTDVSEGKILDDFDRWQRDLFRSMNPEETDIGEVETTAPEELAEISTDIRAQHLANGLALGKVKEIRSLTETDQPEKRHMEVELPEGMSYEVGDYLSVLPTNPDDLVRRVLNHWELPQDAVITLKASVFGSLPVKTPFNIYDLVKGFFELSQTISKSTVHEIKQFTKDENTLKHLDKLLTNDELFDKTIIEQHVSLFNMLSLHTSIKMPFQSFLSSLLPIRIRQYSISSSPLPDPHKCTITYSVVRHESPSINTTNSQSSSDYIHEGVASTYLSNLQSGDMIQIATKSTATANHQCPFRLPTTTTQGTTPLIMYCAGTGLAPFRGFIQQRAIMLESNPNLTLAPALLFIGCRSSTSDRLYADDFDAWEKLGAVSLRYAFSQEPNHEFAAGCRYVADRILKEQAEVRELWERGARIYMCGSRKVQGSAREAVRQIFKSIAEERGWSTEELEAEREKFRASLAGRAVSDVFD